jgi:cell division protein FtsZ
VHQAAPRNFALSGSRAPKRPVLELPAEDEFELPAEAEVADEPQAADGFGSAPEEAEDTLDLGAMPTAYGDEEEENGEEEYDDDVDGIVDPLAGLRNEEPEQYQPAPQGYGAEPAEEERSDEDLWLSDGAGEEEGAQDADASGGQDELLLDADRLAAQDEPVKPMLGGGRRRGLVSGGGEGGSGSGGAGSTLFERMANLSRGGSKASDDEEEEGDDDGDSGSASLSIPRFLGRQNNQ